MVTRNPLFAVRWTRQLLRATVLDDIWPEILFFTTVATVICVISDHVRDLGISSVLLTVLGNVIILQTILSFRTSSASERYQEARALWASLTTITKNLAQTIWIHTPNHRGPQDQTESVEMQAFIEKKSIINLLQALVVSVKHFVRDEQGVYYEDLYPLVSWLPAFSNFTPDHPYWYKLDFRSSSATLLDDSGPSRHATRRSISSSPLRRNRSPSCSGEDSGTDVESDAEAVGSPMRRATSSPRNSEENIPLTQSPTTDEPQASSSKNILDHERCVSPEPTLLVSGSNNSPPQHFRIPPKPGAAEYRYETIKPQQQDVSDNDADSEVDEGEAEDRTSIPLRGLKRVRFHSRTLVDQSSRNSKSKHSRDETLVASDFGSDNVPEYDVESGLGKPYKNLHATYDRILPHVPGFDQLKPAANPPPERIRDVFPLWRFIAFLGRGIKKVAKWDFEEKVQTKRRKRNPYVMIESSVPMQIWLTLSRHVYQSYLYRNKLMPIRAIEDSISNNILNLQNVISQLERLTNTPLPFAYQFHIRVCTWLYLLFLPFQLYDNFGYVTIPIVAFFTFLLVGFMEIGQEIENPFDYDPNDLDLDEFCLRLQRELHEITAQIHSEPSSTIYSSRNYPLAPVDWRTADTLIAEDAYHRTEDGRKEQTSAIQNTLYHCWKEIDQVTRKRV